MIRAFLGGSFDPPHLGHLELLKHAYARLSRLGLAFELSVIPTKGSPFKNTQTSFEIRCNLLKLAIQHTQLPISICRIEQHLSAPVYSVDVFNELRARFPGDSLILIVGADSLSQMPTWKHAAQLPHLLNCWVFGRAEPPASITHIQQGSDLLQSPLPENQHSDLSGTAQGLGFVIADQLGQLEEPCGWAFLDTYTPQAISSTQIREQAKTTANTVTLVPKSVARYIEQNSVYVRKNESR